jgi:hypothetical protein
MFSERLTAEAKPADAEPLLWNPERCWRFANGPAAKQVGQLQRLRQIVARLAKACLDRPEIRDQLWLEYLPTVDRLIALFGERRNFLSDGRSMRREPAVEFGTLSVELKRLRKRLADLSPQRS